MNERFNTGRTQHQENFGKNFMGIPHIQNSFDDTQKILMSFARAQLSYIEAKAIKKNSFQLFSITAFLYGAVNQLGKQSTLPDQLIRNYLHNVLCEAFDLPRHNAEGLVSSINRMMDKYYLLENIYHEGEAAAERWLTNDNADCSELKTLLENYQEFTMLDMNAAGMKSNTPSFVPQQDDGHSSAPTTSAFKIIATVTIMAALSLAAYFFLLT